MHNKSNGVIVQKKNCIDSSWCSFGFDTYDNHLDIYDTIGKSKGFGNVGGKKLESNLPVWTANHDLKNELFCYHATALQKNSHMRLEK